MQAQIKANEDASSEAQSTEEEVCLSLVLDGSDLGSLVGKLVRRHKCALQAARESVKLHNVCIFLPRMQR